jgi:hypothetical protein
MAARRLSALSFPDPVDTAVRRQQVVGVRTSWPHDRGEFDGQLWISADFVDGLTDVTPHP